MWYGRGAGDAQLVGGCRWTRDYHELLAAEDVEAVLISLPIHLTAQVLIESVRAGKHVLCEKPLAANLAQGQEVVAAGGTRRWWWRSPRITIIAGICGRCANGSRRGASAALPDGLTC